MWIKFVLTVCYPQLGDFCCVIHMWCCLSSTDVAQSFVSLCNCHLTAQLAVSDCPPVGQCNGAGTGVLRQ